MTYHGSCHSLKSMFYLFLLKIFHEVFLVVLTNSVCLFCVQAEETKIIYHIDGEDTPYLVKIPLPPESVTLADFKAAVNKPNFKYYFKQMDADFGSVTLCSSFSFRALTSRVNSILGVLKRKIERGSSLFG